MYPIQPTGLRGYFRVSPTLNPKQLVSHFYMSWEDAVWDVLKHFRLQTGSVILVPDFFCTDVINNMQTHGLRCELYPVDAQLQTDRKIFVRYLKEVKPNLVILFHPAGITNKLLACANTWLPDLPEGCLILEDCVHRIVNPNAITLLTPNHIVIDSLRKVVPLQGSRLFGSFKLYAMQQSSGRKTIRYQLAVMYWWFLMQCCLQASISSPFSRMKLWWNRMAELYMETGYAVIGDSYIAGKGWLICKWLAQHIDYDYIHDCKKRQVQLYKKLLTTFWNNKNFYPIQFNDADHAQLRGFPVGVHSTHAQKILTTWRDAGVLLRYELDDCVWSQRQKVVFLPLGPHVLDEDIIALVNKLTPL